MNLFFHISPIGLSISDTAKKCNVSSATVRNWIKTNQLEEIKKGIVSKESVAYFLNNIAGKEKLTARANKQQKDTHNHEKLTQFVKQKLNSSDWYNVGKEYEESLSNAYRNKEGIYYTPQHIVKDLLNNVNINQTTTFLDPCCGSGNFILQAIEQGAKPENVYGFDIDENAVKITQKRILEATGFNATNNIQCLDFLKNSNKISQKFDVIFTNPPWGKKITKEEKQGYSQLFDGQMSTDTSSLFYFGAMKLLKPHGTIGFLVQEALSNIASFERTRVHILQHKIVRLVDYQKPFKGLVSRAFAFVVENVKKYNQQIDCGGYTRNQKDFSKNPQAILNFWIDDEQAKTIEKIYAIPHTTLKNKAQWGLGIVTGNNAKHCKKEHTKGMVAVYKGADILPNKLKEPTNFISDYFSQYQQVAPLPLYQSPSKLVYKFISSKLVFFCDTEQRFLLNSANLVIPSEILGISHQQLADLLNSDVMNWLFSSLFKTHKVLRKDLETLPIHTDYFKKYKIFSEQSYLDFLGIKKEKNGTYRIKK